MNFPVRDPGGDSGWHLPDEIGYHLCEDAIYELIEAWETRWVDLAEISHLYNAYEPERKSAKHLRSYLKAEKKIDNKFHRTLRGISDRYYGERPMFYGGR